MEEGDIFGNSREWFFGFLNNDACPFPHFSHFSCLYIIFLFIWKDSRNSWCYTRRHCLTSRRFFNTQKHPQWNRRTSWSTWQSTFSPYNFSLIKIQVLFFIRSYFLKTKPKTLY